MIGLLVEIKGLQDERFQRPMQLLTNLFFEESVVRLSQLPEAQLTASFIIEEEEKLHVSLELQNHETNKTYCASIEKESLVLPDKEAFKYRKNTVLSVYLTALQEMTGIIQKWGYLTGIRPTKILHKALREGMSKEDAHHMLREQFMISDEKINLMQRIIDRQKEAIPDLYELNREVSIYIGIPYCPTKCAYCTYPA